MYDDIDYTGRAQILFAFTSLAQTNREETWQEL